MVLPAPLRPNRVTISPSRHLQADPVQDVALAVEGVEALGRQHRPAHAASLQISGLHGLVRGDFLRRALGQHRSSAKTMMRSAR